LKKNLFQLLPITSMSSDIYKSENLFTQGEQRSHCRWCK